MDYSVYYLYGVIAYFAILLYVSIKKMRNSIGTSFLIGWYLLAAISSLLFYTHPLTFSTTYYRPLAWQGLAYFALLTTALIYPVFRFESHEYSLVKSISDDKMIKVMKVLFVLQLVVLVFYMSDAIRLSGSDFNEMHDNGAAGDSTLTKKNFFVAWALTFCMALRSITTIIAFYALVFVQKKRKFVITFFCLAAVMPFFLSFLFILRGFMLFQVLLLAFLFILFRRRFTAKLRRTIMIAGGALVGGVGVLTTTFANSRFGDLVEWYNYKYAGETMVNFSGQLWPDLSGTTGGQVYFTWFQRLLGFDYLKLETTEKWHYMNEITGVDTHIFYGFIGGLSLEFGFLLAAVIVLALAYLFKRYIGYGKLRLSNLILIGELANLLFSGSFMFLFQGGWGNFEIIFIVALFIYFRKLESRTHESIVL